MQINDSKQIIQTVMAQHSTIARRYIPPVLRMTEMDPEGCIAGSKVMSDLNPNPLIDEEFDD